MDKRAINNFAVKARRDLIRDITNKLGLLGIDEAGIQEKRAESTAEIEYYGELAYEISGDDIRLRRELVSHLKSRVADDWNTVLQDFIEEVAYTWFNRIIAIRFMEVNDYLPSKTRVLSSENGRTEPDILTEAFDIEDDLHGFNSNQRALLAKALDTEIPEDLDKAYTMLFIKQANALNDNLPYLFERTSDYMQLLFTPSYHDGVIKDLIDGIPESDFDVQLEGQVEIIGWLYQYYNEESKDKAIGQPKSHKFRDVEIASVTQIFTPDWIVKYMVQNSVGKYWMNVLKTRPSFTSEKEIAQNFGWEYYMEDADQPIDVETNLSVENENLNKDIQELKVLDPSMGSGHILVYAFDLLMDIYQSEGYSKNEAATSILNNNLFGMDIDRRAFQLAYFALMMKYRQYVRRGLSDENTAHVYDIPSTSGFDAVDFAAINETFSNSVASEIKKVLKRFEHGDEQGSLLNTDDIDFNVIEDALADLKNSSILLDLINVIDTLENSLVVGKTLSAMYEVVITNPPYMGSSRMNSSLSDFAKKQFPNSKSDLFAMFMEHYNGRIVKNGYNAMVTMQSWMFLSSFETMRTYLLEKFTISNLMHMENNVMGIAFGTAVTIVRNVNLPTFVGTYHQIKTADASGKVPKNLPVYGNRYNRTNQSNFNKIQGAPISYWASEKDLDNFEYSKLGEIAEPRLGMATADNTRFLRMWFEVSLENIGFSVHDRREAKNSLKKWFPYNKGGEYKKWYGNNEYVVNWENDGLEIQSFKGTNGKVRSHNYNLDYIFKPAITWNALTSGSFSSRYSEHGYLFDNAGSSMFTKDNEELFYLQGLLTTPVVQRMLGFINPTLNFQPGTSSALPVREMNDKTNVISKTKDAIQLAKVDWDSFETSWNFDTHPLIQHIDEYNRNWTLKEAFEEWKNEAQDRFDQLKDNEEELNRIFIDLYGLQDEMTPDVEDKNVSVRTADEVRDVKSFLSYFVGLVFGRYSLDAPGLIYAGGDWEPGKYKSFQPNKDNVLILTDDSYFNDSRDIINRLKEFLRVTFGDENVQTNLEYIAQVIGKGGSTAEEKIRQYFIKDFYADHVSNYSKRPIYWEYNSGKKEGLRALMYSHRYDADTTGMIRTDYLLPLQEAYENALSNFESLVENETVVKTRKIYEKRVTRLTNQIDEMKMFDQVLQHLATARIEIDLDDGVIENHAKIQDGQKLLTKI
ncbi:MAG: BREX-1 system adenine-specific DNA-methyltransferase PglX [Lactococcus hircilactis]